MLGSIGYQFVGSSNAVCPQEYASDKLQPSYNIICVKLLTNRLCLERCAIVIVTGLFVGCKGVTNVECLLARCGEMSYFGDNFPNGLNR